MAYAQQPRGGVPQRLPYQDHAHSHWSSQEPKGGQEGYSPRVQAAHSVDRPRGGPPQGYQNNNGQMDEYYGYNEEWPYQDNVSGHGDGRYRGRGQNRGGRWPPAQRPQGRPTETRRYASHDPRSRSVPRSKLAPLGRGHYHQQEPYYRSNQYGGPQSHEQRYQPEDVYHNGSQELDNGGYAYDEFPPRIPGNWTSTQYYNHPPNDDGQGYRDPEYMFGSPQPDRGGSYHRDFSPRGYRNDQPPRQPEATGSRLKRSQPTSTRPPEPQHPKPRKSAEA